MLEKIHATTILAVRHQGKVALGGDGQVTLGNIVMKHDAQKIRRLFQGKVLAGFAGAAAGAGAATTLSKRAVRAMSFCKLSIEEMMNFTCEWGKLLWSAIALMEFKLFQW